MVLTKADISGHLLKVCKISKIEAKTLVDCFFEEIRILLAQGCQIHISGFGNFILRDKNERPGRNPKTGENTIIKARRVVTFRAGQKLKDKIARNIWQYIKKEA